MFPIIKASKTEDIDSVFITHFSCYYRKVRYTDIRDKMKKVLKEIKSQHVKFSTFSWNPHRNYILEDIQRLGVWSSRVYLWRHHLLDHQPIYEIN